MVTTPRVGDDVLCPRAGDCVYKVVKEDDRHFWLTGEGLSSPFQIYKVHCHSTTALSIANMKKRLERAERIGNPAAKRPKGRK